MFILQEELKQIEKAEDPNLAWLDLELWRHHHQYEAIQGNLTCPSCQGPFHILHYPNSEVKISVCHACRAVWLNKKMLETLHLYLEKKLTSETITGYLKDIGHELHDLLKGKEHIKSLGIILKLLQYRIFAEFPSIKNLIQNLPKV